MIGYPISRSALDELIENEQPGWLDKATERTEVLRKQGRYEEKSSNWSRVKPVYMKLQGDSKCVFCERKMESIALGKGEQDVEHFRPKGRVSPWEIPQSLNKPDIPFAKAPEEDRGYYLLPYHPFNYAASCKPCNSALKKDYFPIAGTYQTTGDDPSNLSTEKPYLIYPIGDFDQLPEKLIHFHGISPQATAKSGHARARALVTIEFFKLDDETGRKNLLRERAVILIALFPLLVKLADGATGAAKKKAQDLVARFTSPSACHTNCASSFKRLFERDREEAERLFDRATDFFLSGS